MTGRSISRGKLNGQKEQGNCFSQVELDLKDPKLSRTAAWCPTCLRKSGKEKRKQEGSSRSVSGSGAGGREKEEEQRRELAPRELNRVAPGREGLKGAVRSRPDRPAHRRAGAGPHGVSPGIGRGEGVTLGRYQQSGAAEAGGWVWDRRVCAGRVAREWPGRGWAGAAVAAAAGGGERGVGLPLPGGGGGGRTAPHRTTRAAMERA